MTSVTGLSDALLGASTNSNIHAITSIAGSSEAIRHRINAIPLPKMNKYGLPVGVKPPEKRLTLKMKHFITLLGKGYSPKEAYRESYNCSRYTEASIVANANTLMKDTRITRHLDYVWDCVRENMINDVVVARQYVLQELIKHSKGMGSDSTKLKALELIGKASGMFIDRVEQKVEVVDVEQLKKELDDMIARME